MKFFTYFINFKFGSFLANYSISEENPKPMIVDVGLEKTLERVSSRTSLF